MPKKAKTMPKRKSDTTGTDNRQEASARANRSRIRDFVMRSGGEPFGPPYELGPPSLTEKIVAFFKQKGFFGFETRRLYYGRGYKFGWRFVCCSVGTKLDWIDGFCKKWGWIESVAYG